MDPHMNMDHGVTGMDDAGMTTNMDDAGMTTTPTNMNMPMEHNMSSGHGDSFVVQVAATILFRQWKTTTWEEMLGSCLAVGVVACLYEGFKLLRDVLLRRFMKPKARRCSQMFSVLHAVQTILYMIQVFISLCLMMVFMTFNVWLCIAVVVGAGVGYFFFGFRRLASVVDMDDHCQ